MAKEESAADLALFILLSSYSSRMFGRSDRLVGIGCAGGAEDQTGICQ